MLSWLIKKSLLRTDDCIVIAIESTNKEKLNINEKKKQITLLKTVLLKLHPPFKQHPDQILCLHKQRNAVA